MRSPRTPLKARRWRASASASWPRSSRGTRYSRRCPTLRRLLSRRSPAPSATPSGCFWAEPGRLLAGHYPGGSLEELLEAGVTLFVDLTEEGELAPYAGRLVGARHVRFPILDMWVASDEQLRQTLDAIDDELDSGGTVLVHCWGGCGRTGTVVAAWWVRHGADPADAVARYQQLCRAYSSRRCPETPEQVAMVMRWRRGQ